MNYNWNMMQIAYDNGLSQRELAVKFNIPNSLVQAAVKEKLLICRSPIEARILAKSQGKCLITKDGRRRLSESAKILILARYEAGWMPKAGRCKKFSYSSPIAGDVLVDGTWELAVAGWLDQQHYNWRRNVKRFEYTNLSGTISHYTPDFWVEELNGYLEIKGYETALDRCKWSQFTEPLIIWKKSDLIDRLIINK